MSAEEPIGVYLVCNARYHDTNFARVELLKLLGEQPDVVTRVGENYSQLEAILSSRLLITYTCDLRPSIDEQMGLKRFLDGGGRWFALHGTNAIIEFVGDPVESGGVRIPGTLQVRPPTPPPDIDVEYWHASIDRLRALEPRTLDLTHFGRFHDPGRHFDDLLYRLDDWTTWVDDRLRDGFSRSEMATALRLRSDAEIAEDGDVAATAAAFELATPADMTVDGLVRYLNGR